MTADPTEGNAAPKDAYDLILDAIDRGIYAPGSRLLETDLAQRLGVSRTPVREALRRLETQGVVVHEPRRGAVVATLDYSQMGELYAVREALEAMAAKLAARHATPEEVDVLSEMVAEERGMTTGSDLARANKRFHRQLHFCAHNRFLNRTLEHIRRSLVLLAGTTLAHKARADQSTAEHAAIVEAIQRRDEAAAEEIARKHISNAYRFRVRLETEG